MENEQNPTTKVVMTRPKKSMGIALTLTILFGPLGLLYASISCGLIVMFGAIFTAIYMVSFSEPELLPFDLDVISALFWIVSIVLCVLAVRNHNRNCL